MRKHFSSGFLLFLFLITAALFGQNKDVRLQLFGGTSLGIGSFAEKTGSKLEITRRSGFSYGSDVGLASAGFTFGAEITFPVLIDGLGWQLSSKLIVNPTNKDEIEAGFNRDPQAVKDIIFETGSWINIPIFSGFSYGINLVDKLNLYAHLQAGINFTQQANRKATYDGTVVEDTKYKMVPDFGLETGLSLEYADKYVISIRYLDLGRPRYEGTRYLNEKLFSEIPKRDFIIEAEEKPVSVILLTLGFKM